MSQFFRVSFLLFFAFAHFAAHADPASEYRILVLENSVSTVEVERDPEAQWPRLLQNKLKNDFAPSTVRVLNLGGPLVNSALLAQRLRERITDFKPQIVMVMMGLNEGEPFRVHAPSLMQRARNFFRAHFPPKVDAAAPEFTKRLYAGRSLYIIHAPADYEPTLAKITKLRNELHISEAQSRLIEARYWSDLLELPHEPSDLVDAHLRDLVEARIFSLCEAALSENMADADALEVLVNLVYYREFALHARVSKSIRHSLEVGGTLNPRTITYIFRFGLDEDPLTKSHMHALGYDREEISSYLWTRARFNEIADLTRAAGAKLVLIQYPGLPVASLRRLLGVQSPIPQSDYETTLCDPRPFTQFLPTFTDTLFVSNENLRELFLKDSRHDYLAVGAMSETDCPFEGYTPFTHDQIAENVAAALRDQRRLANAHISDSHP